MESSLSRPLGKARASKLAYEAKDVSRITMNSNFKDIPQRIFLDSSTLQTLQDYGGFIYENESLAATDPVHRDQKGIAKIETLRMIMQIAERAPFEFALSSNSFAEVHAKMDSRYLQWAYDVLDHWLACLEESVEPSGNPVALAAIGSNSFNYLGEGDRALLRDALALECDTFLTMENKLPKNADHIERTLDLRVLSPIGMWDYLQPWAALFR